MDKAGYKWGEQIFVALDPATSELWNEAEKDGKDGYKLFSSTQRGHEHRRADRLLGPLVRELPHPLHRGRAG